MKRNQTFLKIFYGKKALKCMKHQTVEAVNPQLLAVPMVTCLSCHNPNNFKFIFSNENSNSFLKGSMLLCHMKIL